MTAYCCLSGNLEFSTRKPNSGVSSLCFFIELCIPASSWLKLWNNSTTDAELARPSTPRRCGTLPAELACFNLALNRGRAARAAFNCLSPDSK